MSALRCVSLFDGLVYLWHTREIQIHMQNADINIATKCWSVGSVSAFCNVYQHLTWVYFWLAANNFVVKCRRVVILWSVSAFYVCVRDRRFKCRYKNVYIMLSLTSCVCVSAFGTSAFYRKMSTSAFCGKMRQHSDVSIHCKVCSPSPSAEDLQARSVRFK